MANRRFPCRDRSCDGVPDPEWRSRRAAHDAAHVPGRSGQPARIDHVTGSSSGLHTGRIVGDSDGQGGSFEPSTPFKPGERVTVRTSLNVVGGLGGAYGFNVAVPAGRIPRQADLRSTDTG